MVVTNIWGVFVKGKFRTRQVLNTTEDNAAIEQCLIMLLISDDTIPKVTDLVPYIKSAFSLLALDFKILL